MLKSDSIKELAAALSKAQGEMIAAKMDSVNPFFKSKYADLGSVIQAAKKPMADNGLSISQHPYMNEKEVGVTNLLMHSSGEWLESSISVPMGNDNGRSLAQSAGSIITYLRRYSFSAILGIYADEDVDDEKPTTPKNSTNHPSSANPANAPKNGAEGPQEAQGKAQSEKTTNVSSALPVQNNAPKSSVAPQGATLEKSKGRPFDPVTLKDTLNKSAIRHSKETVQPVHTQHTAAVLSEILQGDDKRHELIHWLTDGQTGSLKEIGPGMVLALYNWLKPSYDRNAQKYNWDETAAKEATAAHVESLRANGAQVELFGEEGEVANEEPGE